MSHYFAELIDNLGDFFSAAGKITEARVLYERMGLTQALQDTLTRCKHFQSWHSRKTAMKLAN